MTASTPMTKNPQPKNRTAIPIYFFISAKLGVAAGQ
jgi:hypothetical protein